LTNRPSAGETLQSTERRSGDDLALLCAHTLVDMFATTGAPHLLAVLLQAAAAKVRTSGERQALVDAAVVLERAQELSPKNFQFTLLLVRCYAALGAWQAAHGSWQSLGVKHVQLDSMSLWVLQPAVRLLAVDEVAALCEAVERFHGDYAAREVGVSDSQSLRTGLNYWHRQASGWAMHCATAACRRRSSLSS
jgi:hypothetical protein